jgi:uncharacterized membrane protein
MIFFPRKESKTGSIRSALPETALALLALAFTGGTLAAPLLASRGHLVSAFFARWLYSPFCHQELTRSLFLSGFPVSVCHRCLAIYATFTVVLLFSRALVRGEGFSRLALLAFLLPMLLDVGLDLAGALANTPATRMATGVAAGVGLAYFLVPAMRELGRAIRDRRVCSTVTQGH